jgi:serine/threonine protein kinase
MGAVYQAKDVKRQTICAIKEMSLSMVPAHERPQAVQNFKIEAKMLWGLNHPNLPAFTGFFSEGQRYYMVMEYVDGYTLEELLERNNNSPFSERRVLGWARQLCDVVEYLHTQNPPIIFRDMKPGNIMLTRNGRIKLIDFGIARFFRSSSSQDTQLLGTPGFAPPEQYGRAQTDERSDIYSLAITLFQLLTNTLSDNGFGLKDVRLINPLISPSVARALERAAALNPEERYGSVAEFRRALLGVGTFVFDNGDQATTSEELAELCARHPEEAFDYIANGEIESWLQEIGDTTLARAARHIRALDDEPLATVEQFLQVVMGPNARLHNYLPPQSQTSHGTRNSRAGTINSEPPSTTRNGRNWFARKQTSPILVSPHVLDFGTVYPGISAPMVVTISGNQGLLVSGTVYTNEAWLMLDQTQFDGMITRVNVRLDSTDLHNSMHYTGVILIIADGEGTQKEIEVLVEADIVGFASGGRRGKTIGADLDDDEDYGDDDEDELTMGTMTPFLPMTQRQQSAAAAAAPTVAEIGPSAPTRARDNEYKIKYGQPALIRQHGGWDPVQVSPRLQVWLRHTLALLAAFMGASLIYSLISQLPQMQHSLPIPPNPWFIAVLAGITPAATAGALLVNQSTPWTLRDTIDRACTGMTSGFIALVVVRLLWHFTLNNQQPVLQLIILLLVTAIGASAGTTNTISEYINYGISWAMAKFYWQTIIFIIVLGGFLGFLLTLGLPSVWGIIIAILVGMGIGGALLLRVDYLMRQNALNAQNTP